MLNDAIFFGLGFVAYPLVTLGLSAGWEALKKVGYATKDWIAAKLGK